MSSNTASSRLNPGPGDHNRDALEQAFMREGFFYVFRAHFFIGILADHLDVTAEWKGAKRVLGFAFFLDPKLGTEAHRKS